MRRYDLLFAILGTLLSLGMIAYSALAQNVLFATLGIIALMPFVFWLATRGRWSPSEPSSSGGRSALLLAVVFFLLLTLAIMIFRFRPDYYVRPSAFFLIAAVMGGIIAVQCILPRKSSVGVFVQIMALGLLIIFSQQAMFSGPLGTDPWFHQALTDNIVSRGSIPPGSGYSLVPLFHMEIASGMLLLGTNYTLASMLTVAIAQVLGNALFVYLLGRRLVGNSAGLLAALGVTIANLNLFMGTAPIPTSLAMTLAVVLVFIMVKFYDRINLAALSVFFLLTAAIIIMHTVTAVLVSVALFAGFVASILFLQGGVRRSRSFTVGKFALFTTGMLGWWAYASGHITVLAELIQWGFSVDYFVKTPAGVLSYLQSIPMSERLMNQLFMFLFFSIGLVGFLYMLAPKSSRPSSAYAIVAIVPLGIGVFALVTGFGVLYERWWYFAQVLMAVAFGAAILLIIKPVRKRWAKGAVVFSIVTILTLISIASPIVNYDNPLFSPHTGIRYGMTESEIQAITAASEIRNGTVGVDDYGGTVMSNYGIESTSIGESLFYNNFSNSTATLVLLRREVATMPFKEMQTVFVLPSDPVAALEAGGYSRIYSSNTVTIYSR